MRLANHRGADADENEILEILTDTYSVNAFKLAPLFAKMLAPAPDHFGETGSYIL